MQRRRFLQVIGAAGVSTTALAAQSDPASAAYPTIPDETLTTFDWKRFNQYQRTSEQDGGEDTGVFDVDIGEADKWYISEFTNPDLTSKLSSLSNGTVSGRAAYLWSLRVDPSDLTAMGWRKLHGFGEMSEVLVGIDSDAEAEFENRVSDQIAGSIEIYPPQPINMRMAKATAEALLSKLPGGSFIDEAKTWIQGPCSGLVTNSGKGVFYEKYWIRRRVADDELMEYKGIYADWVQDGEFRAVAGAVPWSNEHVTDTLDNLGYDTEFVDADHEREEELKTLMGEVRFR